MAAIRASYPQIMEIDDDYDELVVLLDKITIGDKLGGKNLGNKIIFFYVMTTRQLIVIVTL